LGAKQLGGTGSVPPDEERARLKNWREVSVTSSLKQFVSDYDEHHEAFEESVSKAKEAVPKP
jgi:hypothetical protein